MSRPDLTAILVTYNGRERALQTLRSVRAATGGAEIQWIVIDSGSTDGTPDAIEQQFPDVELVRGENRGFAAGNNVGLGRARGRYVLLLNPDVEISDGTLAELVQAMDQRPSVGLASVRTLDGDGRLQWSIRRFPSVARDLGESLFAARWPVLTRMQELELRPERYEREGAADWLVGAFLIARADAVATVGLMDERFFLYSEEVDWCYRFARAGWEVRHLPVMTIIHYAGGRDRGDLMAQLAHSRRLFVDKHYGWARSRAIRAALALGHVLRVLALVPRAPRDQRAGERLRAERGALSVQLGLARPPRLGVQGSDRQRCAG